MYSNSELEFELNRNMALDFEQVKYPQCPIHKSEAF